MSALLPAAAGAQGQAASGGNGAMKTSGTVRVSLATGRVEGRVCIADRPAEVAGAFALNAGLNVARVTDGDGKAVAFDGWYDPGINGEARVYTVSAAPAVLCVEYVGAYPVYPAHDAPDDFKGVMAFNGDSARFAEQSAWLPLPFDNKAKARAGTMAYALDVSCEGCRFLYMNGSAAIIGDHGRFSSATARPPLLFGGKGPITKTANVTILNETVAPAQADALSAAVGQVASYYRDYMGAPVADQPTFLRMVAANQVKRDREGSEWAFATWPTIAMSGSVGRVGATLQAGGQARDGRIAYIAHEMGHYYFGTLARSPGPYFWFMLESTAEFLSIKALRALGGEAAAQRHIAGLAAEVNGHTQPFVALDKITDGASIGGTYRYHYGPLLLLSLERQVGEAKMRAFLRGLLSARNVRTWADLQGVAARAGIDDAAWERWRSTCVADGRRVCQSQDSLGKTGR
ncbi:hypothetical protein [Sphingomonas sp.]|uniref:hypothetical protein n=1 Tax=Sphingomonas sp. TaxID=28214 RepID=UPI00257C845B|nr:hypothetical protein [Sphingomonas sp.]